MAEEVPAEEESSGRMWSHVLVEWDAMDPLYQPVSATSRIKVQFAPFVTHRIGAQY